MKRNVTEWQNIGTEMIMHLCINIYFGAHILALFFVYSFFSQKRFLCKIYKRWIWKKESVIFPWMYSEGLRHS